ncbi:MAG: spore germination protein, partial [Clostridia bacterium]|nr:spore germination protein [Clostridia bacterium]
IYMYKKLDSSVKAIKGVLTSQDILSFEFTSQSGRQFALIYIDGIADKIQLGNLVVKPLLYSGSDDDIYKIKELLASPEVKVVKSVQAAVQEISLGNALLIADGESSYLSIGLMAPPGRAVAEPPTNVTVKGPREGFTEDIKVNCALVRKRLKTENLQMISLKTGKRSQTAVSVFYLSGVCDDSVAQKVVEQIQNNQIDIVPDSSYVARFISSRPHSLFKRCAHAEKPDIFCAKLCEGRVGIIADGSPIALTVPYMLVEEFQSSEDYFINTYRATTLRLLRVIALTAGIILPGLYVAAQLFKLQLIPFKLLLNISSSVSGLPLSPCIEMFLTLFVLEVLNEASIRMPKYVGLALSVVGALVLGDTAVSAGIISTPAIIIVAFSAICLYVVPDLIETTATLRWIYLIIAGSIGTFGIVLFTVFLISYLVSEQVYGTPLVAPFAPMIPRDMSDGFIKGDMLDLAKRPLSLNSTNTVRYRKKK